MVKNTQEVKELTEMTLYPPHGTRGFGPLLAIGYGATDAKECVEKVGYKNWSELDLDMLFAGTDWCFIYNQGKETLKLMNKYSK